MNASRAADNVNRSAGTFRIRTVMRDGRDAAQEVFRNSHADAQRARDGLDGGDRSAVLAVDGFPPFDIVAIGPTADLFITVELEMVVGINETGKRECAAE